MKPSFTEIEIVVNEMFKQSETAPSISQYIQYYPALIARVKRLTEALEWYAEPRLWGEHPLVPGHKSVLLSVHIDAKDGGDSARKALEEGEE